MSINFSGEGKPQAIALPHNRKLVTASVNSRAMAQTKVAVVSEYF